MFDYLTFFNLFAVYLLIVLIPTCAGEGEANSGGYTLGGADGSTSLLPEHVYHTLLESGRYSRNSNGGVGGNGGGGGSVGLGHSHHLGGAMGHSNGQGSHNNIMAARARATKAALHQHLQFQYPSQVKAEGTIRTYIYDFLSRRSMHRIVIGVFVSHSRRVLQILDCRLPRRRQQQQRSRHSGGWARVRSRGY